MSFHKILPQVKHDIAELENFTFEQWCQLNKDDPEQFDACRLKLLNNLVDSAPQSCKSRLRGLMFTMEGESQRAKSPEDYNLKLGIMMMNKLTELQSQLTSVSNSKSTGKIRTVASTVIPIHKPS